MSEQLQFTCPSCGSTLFTDGKSKEVVCQYCGRAAVVPPELREPEPAPAPPEQRIVVELPPAFEAAAAAAAATQPARPMPRRRGGVGGCLMVIAIFAVVAGIGALTEPRTSSRLSQAAAIFPTPRPTIVPVDRPLTAPAGTTAYAGLQLSVTGGRITNQVQGAATTGEAYLAPGQANAYVVLKVANPTTNGIEADQKLFTLQLGDGARYQEASGWANWVDGESTQEAKLYFRVPISATWQGARLLIGTPGKEPAQLVINGPAAPARYPMLLRDKGQATAGSIDYEIESATVDLDDNGQRAATGHRFLKFDIRVFNHNSYPLAITGSDFRLAAGRDMLAPSRSLSEAVEANSVYTGEVVFDISAGAGKVELQVGDINSGPTKRLPLTLPGS